VLECQPVCQAHVGKLVGAGATRPQVDMDVPRRLPVSSSSRPRRLRRRRACRRRPPTSREMCPHPARGGRKCCSACAVRGLGGSAEPVTSPSPVIALGVECVKPLWDAGLDENWRRSRP